MNWKPKTNKDAYEALKKAVYDYYGNRCKCCGETIRHFLTIDHVDNDGYLEKSSKGYKLTGYAFYDKIIKENFPIRFQLLCYNCNCGKHRNHGICPHQE